MEHGKRHVLETDVLVIGAGPAGCSTGIQLLKQGKSVVFVDKSQFPRSAPGETLHPGAEQLLRELGVWDSAREKVASRHKGISSAFRKQVAFQAYNESEDWRGFQFKRSELDFLLLQEVVRLGARTFLGQPPQEVVTDSEGNVCKIICEGLDIRPSYVIDASGRANWLGRRLEIARTVFSPSLLAWYGHVKSWKDGEFSTPRLCWTSNGWTWLAAICDGLVSWTQMDVIRPQSRHSNWLPSQLLECEAVGRTRGIDVTWQVAEVLSANNWFMVGDAAFVLDPASSHGWLKATMSGMLVAHLINSSSSLNIRSMHWQYKKWATTTFHSDRARLQELYANRIEDFEEHWGQFP